MRASVIKCPEVMSMRKLVPTVPTFGMISRPTFFSNFFWDTLYLPALYKMSSLIKALRSKKYIFLLCSERSRGDNRELDEPETGVPRGFHIRGSQGHVVQAFGGNTCIYKYFIILCGTILLRGETFPANLSHIFPPKWIWDNMDTDRQLQRTRQSKTFKNIHATNSIPILPLYDQDLILYISGICRS